MLAPLLRRCSSSAAAATRRRLCRPCPADRYRQSSSTASSAASSAASPPPSTSSSSSPASPSAGRRVLVGNLATDLAAPASAIKFVVRQTTSASGLVFDEEGFVVRGAAGAVHAFENRCVHTPIELDLDDGDFFCKDGRYIQCKMHGARYDPASGECVRGPPGCAGRALRRIGAEVDAESGDIYVDLPAEGGDGGG